jgi:hypothetical protein
MTGRALFTHIIAALVGAAICGAALMQNGAKIGRESSLTERRMKLFETENIRLRALVQRAEKVRSAAEIQQQTTAIEKSVEEIRGMPFKQPVNYNVLSRSEIKEVVSDKLSEVFSEAEFDNISAALGRLGVLPENYPLRQSYVDLLGEQIAAFYDQHTHKLFMFEDASLDNAQNRVVLAHELMHAMQDQYFGLKNLPLEIKTNDDRAISASALAEGEATLVMSEYMLKNLSLATLKDTMAATLTQNMEQLQKAPRFLREMLVFPYLRGQEFCTALFARGGYEAITKAYQHPPSSSSQILHPEKYLSEPREEPIVVQWPDVTFGGVAPTVDNVLGEFGVRQLLADVAGEKEAEAAALGWRGDRYLSFGRGAILVWKTLWATEADAIEFMQAHIRFVKKRYTAAQERSSEDAFEIDGPRSIRLHRTHASVMLVDAPAPDKAAQILARFGH